MSVTEEDERQFQKGLKELDNRNNIPRAICLKCGKRYTGWALLEKKHRYCKCGYVLSEVIKKCLIIMMV